MLENIIKEIEAFEPGLFTPSPAVAKDEVVVGQADETAQRLYAAWMFHQREYERLKLDASYQQAAPAEAAQRRRHRERGELFRSLFWFYLREQLDVWNTSDFGVRTGWSVVIKK